MKLLASTTSPFARKVRIALAEKRLDCELLIDIPWLAGTQVPQFNPLGKIPVLLLDDGSSLYDSRVIVEYLDRLSPVGRLLPENARAFTRAKKLEALADGIADAAALVVVERRRPAEQQAAFWINRQLDKVAQGLRVLDEELGDASYLVEDGFSLADIAAGCTLAYLEFRFPELAWATQYPRLAALHERLLQRSSFRDTVPHE